VVGYVDFLHLLPAFIGFLLFAVAETMLWVGWRQIRSQVRNSQVEEGATRIAR
jgi:uncharacterized membrane protein